MLAIAVARAGVVLPLRSVGPRGSNPPYRFLHSTEEGHRGRKRVLALTFASQAVGWWTLRVEGVVIISGGLGFRDGGGGR